MVVPLIPSLFKKLLIKQQLPVWALYVHYANALLLQNVQFIQQQPDYRPAGIFDDVSELQLNEVNIPVCSTLPVFILKSVSKRIFSKLTLPADESKAVVELFSY
jgi:hypothetical protein